MNRLDKYWNVIDLSHLPSYLINGWISFRSLVKRRSILKSPWSFIKSLTKLTVTCTYNFLLIDFNWLYIIEYRRILINNISNEIHGQIAEYRVVAEYSWHIYYTTSRYNQRELSINEKFCKNIPFKSFHCVRCVKGLKFRKNHVWQSFSWTVLKRSLRQHMSFF